MRNFQIAVMAAAAVLFASCVRHLDDVQLTSAPRAPAAFTYSGGAKPYLRTWADFYFYPQASLEMRKGDRRWVGNGAISGGDTAVTIREGCVLENTTAHPQYYEIQFLIPAGLETGQVIPLRTAASLRAVVRNDSYGGKFSFASVGELAVDGMTGLDIPTVQPWHSVRVGTATIERLSPTTMTLRLAATIPLRFVTSTGKIHYRLQVHRTYVLKRKRPGNA